MDRTIDFIVATRRHMIRLHEDGKLKAAQIAETFGISEKTFFKWKRRFRKEGEAGLRNRCSRPHRSPRKTSPELEEQVIEVRKKQPKGPNYLAHLPELKGKISAHGIYQVLCRHDFNRLSVKSGVKPLRYVKQQPWELIHLDVKYLPAIKGGHGREYQFTAIDDRTREAFAAIFPSKNTKHARRFLVDIAKSIGVPIRAVLTDNGKEFVSGVFKGACRELGIKHKRTRPRRPQTNGKVERFHRTEDEELYFRMFTSSEERKAALDEFLVYYNEDRLHSSLGYRPPRAVCIELGGRKSA